MPKETCFKAKLSKTGVGVEKVTSISRMKIQQKHARRKHLPMLCGYSGEGEHRFRREAERRSGAKVNSSRSEATLA
jgi:hypothetical protein